MSERKSMAREELVDKLTKLWAEHNRKRAAANLDPEVFYLTRELFEISALTFEVARHQIKDHEIGLPPLRIECVFDV